MSHGRDPYFAALIRIFGAALRLRRRWTPTATPDRSRGESTPTPAAPRRRAA